MSQADETFAVPVAEPVTAAAAARDGHEGRVRILSGVHHPWKMPSAFLISNDFTPADVARLSKSHQRVRNIPARPALHRTHQIACGAWNTRRRRNYRMTKHDVYRATRGKHGLDGIVGKPTPAKIP